MKITKLDLRAFKSYRDVEFPLEAPRVLIAGLNNSGKTSVRESVKWALTGRCQGLDGKGSGAELLIPAGTDFALVGMQIPDVGTLSRLQNGSGASFKVEGWSGTGVVQQSALYAKLAPNPTYLDAVLDSGLFLDLHHAEAKALVLALLNVRIKLGEAENAPVYSLEELDRLYDQAFEDRKGAKVRLKAFHLPPLPSLDPHPPKPDVETQLAKLKGQLEALTRETGEGLGRRAELQRQIERAKVRETHFGALTEDEVVTAIADLDERLSIVEADEAPVAMSTFED